MFYNTNFFTNYLIFYYVYDNILKSKINFFINHGRGKIMDKAIYKISVGFSIYGFLNLILYVVLRCFGVVDFKLAAYASFVLFSIAIWAPWLLHIYFKVEFPKYVIYIYSIFIAATTIFGNVWDAYSFVPYYDKFIHFGSGIMIPLIFICMFNSRKANHLTPFWLFLFALACAVSVGAMWEICEYVFDGIFETNSQNAIGESGRGALFDSMLDLICDTLGGIIGASRVVAIQHSKLKEGELKTIF